MRLIPFGTPSKSKEYVFPAGRLKPYLLSVAAGAVLLAVLVAAFTTGAKTVATPGALASPHAPVEKRCATCHAPGATEVRCEYCHDPFGTSRFENAGHVWFGTKNPQLVAKAKDIECAQCHSDHHGLEFSMRRVDERQCASCHFRSMAKHPQIALVKAGKMLDEGIHFNHKRHMVEVQKKNLEMCLYCHEPTGDRKGFEAISFDRHCVLCHLNTPETRKTEPVAPAVLILPRAIGASWSDAIAANIQEIKRGEVVRSVVYQNVTHRDPWILYNLWNLSREVDPTGLAAKRQVLASRIDDLNFQLRQPPTGGLAPAVLKTQQDGIAAQLKQLGNDPGRLAERRRLEKALARVRVQIELGPLRGMTAPRPQDRRELLGRLADAKAALDDFDNYAAGPSPTLTEDERQARLAAAAAITAPCAKCHIFNGPLIKSVRAAMPVLDHARFNHLPHVQQLQKCQACHTGIEQSAKAEDVNLPGIANCQSCHRPGKSKADCAFCHRYHPQREPWPPI
ncbi:MAG TPA: cytochrome c3 family protein [Thermoanaerobaculia bacterium]|jgi:hypothetical protein